MSRLSETNDKLHDRAEVEVIRSGRNSHLALDLIDSVQRYGQSRIADLELMQADTKEIAPLTPETAREALKAEVGQKLRELRGKRAANDMSSVMGGGTQTLLDAEKGKSWLGWEKVEKLLLSYKVSDEDFRWFKSRYALTSAA
jgi:hypothetical protein